jgi:hypothetical protein
MTRASAAPVRNAPTARIQTLPPGEFDTQI